MKKTAFGVRGARKLSCLLLSSASGLVALTMPQVALAQASEDGASDAIVVTARKQSETLQEVPVTVSVVSRKSLEDYNVGKVEDIASRVPTLNVQVGGSGSGGAIALRGVGSSAISASFDSAVAFDMDGVQVSTMRMVQAGFFDMAQIEVLKGPQSLYFGKSASAGVLSLKSAEPTKTWVAGFKGSYETEEDGYVVGGYVSGPLSDTLGVRVAAQYTDVQKFMRLQAGTPAINDPRGLKDFVGRLTLNWNPLDNFTANLKFQYVRNENDGAISQSDIYCGKNGRADEIWLLSGAVAIPAGYDCNSSDGRSFLPDTAPALAKSVPLPSKAAKFGGKPFGQTDLYFGRLRFDVGLTDSLNLTSTSGFVDLNAVDLDNYSYGGVGPAFSPLGNFLNAINSTNINYLAAIAPALSATNGPNMPGGVGVSDPINKLTQYSQELRLASKSEGSVNFMLGAFYEWRRFVFDTAQNGVNISLIAPDPITGYTYDWDKNHTTKTEAYSLFGSMIFDLTDQLELSGGLRYTKENKTQTIRVPYVHLFLSSLPVFVDSGFYSGPIKFSDDNVSPEVTLKYKVSPDFNVFGSFKTGFKSGGIDNSALPSNSLSQAALSGDFSSLIYKSEKAKGGEIGFKSQLAGRTLTLNGTAYYYVFKDLQVQTFNATTVQFITQNAGEVTTKGAELELGWRTPVEGLNLTANLSWLNGKFTKNFFNPGPDGIGGNADDINLKNRRVARAPEWAGNIAFDYSVPIGSSLSFGMSGNMTFSDKYYTTNVSLEDYVQKSYATFDGRISIGSQDDRWRVALVGINLADKIITQTSGSRPFLAPANPYGIPVGDDIILNQNRGRQVFIEASVKF